MVELPPIVVNKARLAGATRWLDQLPDLIASLEREWAITVGPPYSGGTEAFVAPAQFDDGSLAVLKLLVPHNRDGAAHEISALQLDGGKGCARLLRHDAARRALLLERLGRPLAALGLDLDRRLEILATTAMAVWRPAAGCGLPTGAEKGEWLIDYISTTWAKLDRPCSERAVDYALACAARRIAAHDDDRAVLVHGDVNQWNVLECGSGFKAIDPDGLLAEAEYDLGVLMREDPQDQLEGDPRDRARRLAERCRRDPVAVWEWGAVERVSTGLLCATVDLQPVGRQLLEVAERAATL